jgi:hypothetical protein
MISALDYGRPREINGLLVAVSKNALRGLFQHFLLNVRSVEFPELVVA